MSLNAYLFVSTALLAIGIAMIIARRNLIYILMGIELILNAANLNLVAFARFNPNGALAGQMFAIFVIILAVCEAAVALAIVLNIFGLFDSVRAEDPDLLRE